MMINYQIKLSDLKLHTTPGIANGGLEGCESQIFKGS